MCFIVEYIGFFCILIFFFFKKKQIFYSPFFLFFVWILYFVWISCKKYLRFSIYSIFRICLFLLNVMNKRIRICITCGHIKFYAQDTLLQKFLCCTNGHLYCWKFTLKFYFGPSKGTTNYKWPLRSLISKIRSFMDSGCNLLKIHSYLLVVPFRGPK